MRIHPPLCAFLEGLQPPRSRGPFRFSEGAGCSAVTVLGPGLLLPTFCVQEADMSSSQAVSWAAEFMKTLSDVCTDVQQFDAWMALVSTLLVRLRTAYHQAQDKVAKPPAPPPPQPLHRRGCLRSCPQACVRSAMLAGGAPHKHTPFVTAGGRLSDWRPPPPLTSPGMHGAGLWGAVGHTSIQYVCCCAVVGPQGQEPWCGGGACTYGEQQQPRMGSPPAGPNNELNVCSSGRNVGLLNLAV